MPDKHDGWAVQRPNPWLRRGWEWMGWTRHRTRKEAIDEARMLWRTCEGMTWKRLYRLGYRVVKVRLVEFA